MGKEGLVVVPTTVPFHHRPRGRTLLWILVSIALLSSLQAHFKGFQLLPSWTGKKSRESTRAFSWSEDVCDPHFCVSFTNRTTD
jgi:hypothetical protein